MNTTKLTRSLITVAAVLSVSGLCQAAWNVDKARDIGEEALTARHFANDFEKAKYITGRLGEALAYNGVAPNGTITGRVGAFLLSGTADQGKCQWCAETLREALRSAGVSPKNMFIVYGDVHPFSVNALHMNRSHAALAVVVGGKVLVFDLWKHGMEKGTFKGAGGSKWNGRLLLHWAWGLRNYEYFGFEGATTKSNATAMLQPFQAELLAAWKTENAPKRVAPPTPRTGTSRLKSGTYMVEAGGAMLSWALVVTASGAITGTCNGSENLKGSLTGDVLTLQRACPGYAPPYQNYKGTFIGGKFVGTFSGAGVEPGSNHEWLMRLQ